MSNELDKIAKSIRLDILRLAEKAGKEGKGAHIAPSLSAVEILAVLFCKIMRPQDIFILSKGHGGLAYYAALKAAGAITSDLLDTFEADGGDLPGQPSKNAKHNIVYSGGSLGMGLSYACGLALAAKMSNEDKKIYVLLGDGELNEGSNWEAVMLAKQQKLNNLVAVIDCNGMQSDGETADIISLDIDKTFRSYGWDVKACDGHSTGEIESVYRCGNNENPLAIIARTIKGKGVSFMENNNVWHHNRLIEKQYQDALSEVEYDGV